VDINLILIARRADRLEALAERIDASYGRDVEVLVADLTDESDIARVEDILRPNPHIQMLVNNAGIARLSPFAAQSLETSLAQTRASF
jgi:short-subunit dehydrogenase